ncbi:hypothetical protein ACJQWK_11350 [Exserohilum turcicum]
MGIYNFEVYSSFTDRWNSHHSSPYTNDYRSGYSTETSRHYPSHSSSSHSTEDRDQPSTRTHRRYHTEERRPSGSFFPSERVHQYRDEYSRVPPRDSTSYRYTYRTYRAPCPSPPLLPPKRAAAYSSSRYTAEERYPSSQYSAYFSDLESTCDSPPSPREYSSSYAYSWSKPHDRTGSSPYYSYSDSSRTSSSSSSSSSSSRTSDSSDSSNSSYSSTPSGTKPPRDLYTVLGVSRNASSADVKRAYRAMSLKWHPDRCGDKDKDRATEKMAEINQARTVLGDEAKRAHYDRWGLLPDDS